MNLIGSFRVAINAIWVNKMRSLLTMLGIIIGISSVITVVALGQGSQTAIDEEFEQFGTSRAYIRTSWQENLTKDYLTDSDLEALKIHFPISSMQLSKTYPQPQKYSLKVIRSTSSLMEQMKTLRRSINQSINGRYLTDSDVKTKSVAVIDKNSA